MRTNQASGDTRNPQLFSAPRSCQYESMFTGATSEKAGLLEEAHRGSLLLNEIRPGFAGREHSHDVEHGMYFIRGRGRFTLDGKAYPVGPGTAVFAPPRVPHSLSCEGDEPLQYVVIYAPGGTEQELRARGEAAYGR